MSQNLVILIQLFLGGPDVCVLLELTPGHTAPVLYFWWWLCRNPWRLHFLLYEKPQAQQKFPGQVKPQSWGSTGLKHWELGWYFWFSEGPLQELWKWRYSLGWPRAEGLWPRMSKQPVCLVLSTWPGIYLSRMLGPFILCPWFSRGGYLHVSHRNQKLIIQLGEWGVHGHFQGTGGPSWTWFFYPLVRSMEEATGFPIVGIWNTHASAVSILLETPARWTDLLSCWPDFASGYHNLIWGLTEAEKTRKVCNPCLVGGFNTMFRFSV